MLLYRILGCMTNQDLTKKLSDLKHVAPSQEWLDKNRVLLLAQISNSGAETLPAWRVAVINFSSFTRAAARPATAFGAFVLMLLFGSVYSQQIFAQAKPNDSLYIARIISEQVRLNTTFNEATRDKLAVQYASNHAQDITAVLANPEFNKEENKDKVAKLNDSFKAEMETVKQKITRLNSGPVANDNKEDLPPVVSEADLAVVIADSSKDEKGIQVQENHPTSATQPLAVAYKTSGSEEATSTTTPETVVEKNDASKILEEVQQLFEAKDYEKASEKIQEVNQMINK